MENIQYLIKFIQFEFLAVTFLYISVPGHCDNFKARSSLFFNAGNFKFIVKSIFYYYKLAYLLLWLWLTAEVAGPAVHKWLGWFGAAV